MSKFAESYDQKYLLLAIFSLSFVKCQIFGENSLVDGYPATKEGQREFLESVNIAQYLIPKNKRNFWWEPAVVGGLGARSYFDEDRTRSR